MAYYKNISGIYLDIETIDEIAYAEPTLECIPVEPSPYNPAGVVCEFYPRIEVSITNKTDTTFENIPIRWYIKDKSLGEIIYSGISTLSYIFARQVVSVAIYVSAISILTPPLPLFIGLYLAYKNYTYYFELAIKLIKFIFFPSDEPDEFYWAGVWGYYHRLEHSLTEWNNYVV